MHRERERERASRPDPDLPLAMFVHDSIYMLHLVPNRTTGRKRYLMIMCMWLWDQHLSPSHATPCFLFLWLWLLCYICASPFILCAFSMWLSHTHSIINLYLFCRRWPFYLSTPTIYLYLSIYIYKDEILKYV